MIPSVLRDARHRVRRERLAGLGPQRTIYRTDGRLGAEVERFNGEYVQLELFRHERSRFEYASAKRAAVHSVTAAPIPRRRPVTGGRLFVAARIGGSVDSGEINTR